MKISTQVQMPPDEDFFHCHRKKPSSLERKKAVTIHRNISRKNTVF